MPQPDESTISVIIPVRNRPELLLRALKSVRAQTLQPAEIIIVDDASDPPIETALGRSAFDGATVLRSDTNRGAAAARNIGIAAARGSYIAFLDSDDIWHPEKLAAQLAFMHAADSTICTTGFWLRRRFSRGHAELRLPADGVDVRHLIWGVDLSPGSTLIAKREALQAIGPQDEHMRRLEDWDWLLRAAYRYRIDVLGRPLTTVDESPLTADPLPVRRNAMRVLRLHAWQLCKRSPLNVMRLASTVFIETAASNYRANRISAAVFYGLASVIAWPFRNRQFYERVVTKLLPSRKEVAKSARAKLVMHVISGLDDGGAERALANLVLHERSEGQGRPALEQIVVSLSGMGIYGPILKRSGIEVVPFDLHRLASLMGAIMQIARLIRARRPDVMKCWMYHANLVGTLAAMLSRRRRLMRIYWGIRCSDMDVGQYTWSLAWARRLGAWLSSLPDLIVVNSFRGAAVHIGLGYRTSQLVVFDNGVDINRFRPDDGNRDRWRQEFGFPKDAFVVGIVARVDPMKGYDILQEALRRCPGVRCVAVGRGTDRLQQSEQFFGMGRRNNVEEILPAFDALVSPSAFGEGWSNAIAEAMAAGLPVIATDVGDASRIVGDTGMIVPPGNIEALAEAMRQLQHDFNLRAGLGIAAHLRAVEKFSLDVCATRYERLLLDGVVDTNLA